MIAQPGAHVSILLGITWVRILLVPVVMALILLGPDRSTAYTAAAVFFVVAGATDFIDGYLARRWARTTTFGSFLDTTADKLLVSGALIALVDVGRASPWVAVIIIGRELLILGLRGVLSGKGEPLFPRAYLDAPATTAALCPVVVVEGKHRLRVAGAARCRLKTIGEGFDRHVVADGMLARFGRFRFLSDAILLRGVLPLVQLRAVRRWPVRIAHVSDRGYVRLPLHPASRHGHGR